MTSKIKCTIKGSNVEALDQNFHDSEFEWSYDEELKVINSRPQFDMNYHILIQAITIFITNNSTDFLWKILHVSTYFYILGCNIFVKINC